MAVFIAYRTCDAKREGKQYKERCSREKQNDRNLLSTVGQESTTRSGRTPYSTITVGTNSIAQPIVRSRASESRGAAIIDVRIGFDAIDESRVGRDRRSTRSTDYVFFLFFFNVIKSIYIALVQCE